MGFHSRDSESGILCPDTDDKVVEGNLCFIYIASDVTVIYGISCASEGNTCHGQSLVDWVDGGAFRFDELDCTGFVTKDMPDRLHDRSCFH